MTSSTLRIIAMILMLIDHTGSLLFPTLNVLRFIGRLAFPIFAFLLAEGCRNTKNKTKYATRLFIFAILSELPFNLMTTKNLLAPTHQNVLWTLLIALLVITGIDYTVKNFSIVPQLIFCTAIPVAGFSIANLLNTDYNAGGVAMVLLFYIFHDKSIKSKLCQLVGMLFITIYVIGSFKNYIDIGIYKGIVPFEVLATLSLALIWMYNGEKGIDNKAFKALAYSFYPCHIIILLTIYTLNA